MAEKDHNIEFMWQPLYMYLVPTRCMTCRFLCPIYPALSSLPSTYMQTASTLHAPRGLTNASPFQLHVPECVRRLALAQCLFLWSSQKLASMESLCSSYSESSSAFNSTPEPSSSLSGCDMLHYNCNCSLANLIILLKLSNLNISCPYAPIHASVPGVCLSNTGNMTQPYMSSNSGFACSW